MKLVYTLGLILFIHVATWAQSKAIFMTIPNIEGESTTPGYAKSIILNSSQFKSSVSINISPGGNNTGTGPFELSDIIITKPVDRSSTTLMQRLAGGVKIAKVTISYVSSAQRDNQVLYEIQLEDVFLTSHAISMVPSCPDCTDLSESFEFTYKKILIITSSIGTKGESVPNPVRFGYDRTTGKTF